MKEYAYGFFPGGDPRKFYPDTESCTEEEIKLYREHCALWDQGFRPADAVKTCEWIHGENGSTIHVARSAYGLGTYSFDWDEESIEEQS